MKREPRTENDVKAMVKDWFDDREAWSYAPVQNGLGVHGIPDRIGCVPILVTPEMVGKMVGMFVSVEAKKPGRRGEKDRGLSKHQVLVLEDVRNAYGVAVCCDGPLDIGALEMQLHEIQHG